MSIIDTLIFDRTLGDVLRVKALADIAHTREMTAEELAEWNADVVRGAYNASDINRVGEAIEYTDAYLSEVQSIIDAYRMERGVADDVYFDAQVADPSEIIAPWTDYTISEPPIMADNVMRTFRAAQVMAARVRIPYTAPDISRLTYQDANRVERMIFDAYHYAEEKEITRKDAAERMSKAWYHADDLFCGEI